MSETDHTKTNRHMGKFLFSAGGVILILIILTLVNVIASQVHLRWDATQDNLYSLSKGSKAILDKIEKDVTIKFFYTKDNPNTPLNIKTYAQRLKDFLSEYQRYSNGKVTVEVYNPKPDSEEEEWAQKYGLEPVELQTGERFWFGLAAMAADQEEVIKTIDPTREEQLEYDITRIISRVQSPKKQKIGVISGLPVFGQPQMPMMQRRQNEPWLFITELKKTYQVEEIPMTTDTIDPTFNLLIVIHPKDASETLQYAIDQYVLKGGNVMVFADAFATADESQGFAKASTLDKLFNAWGISMETTKALADMDHPTKVRAQNGQPEDNPTWISARQELFNKEDIITGKLETMLFPIPGILKKNPDSSFEYESLIHSSPNSQLVETFRATFGSAQLRRDFAPSNIRYDLAVRVRGVFNTAFPNGKPKPKDAKPEDVAPPAPGLTKGEKKATVIVVADTDLLVDHYYVSRQNFLGFNISRMFNDNLNFLLNACEMLTGAEDLISIRSRAKFERPFIKVQELEKKAQSRWMAREQELTKKADEANRKLRELEQKKDASQKFIMSEEQQAEIKQFQEEKKRINKELKEVRRNLRADIESLGNRIKFVNIFLMPFVVSVAGVAYGLYRRRKAERRLTQTEEKPAAKSA